MGRKIIKRYVSFHRVQKFAFGHGEPHERKLQIMGEVDLLPQRAGCREAV